MKISQISQENTYVGASLIKLQACRLATVLKRDAGTSVFKSTYFEEHLQTAASVRHPQN